MLDWKGIRTVFNKEIVEILRNKRIVITAFLIPLAIYPLVFFGMDWLQKLEQKKLEDEGYKIALSTGAEEISLFLRGNSDVPVNIIHADPVYQAVLGGDADLGLEWENRSGENRRLWLFFAGSEDRSIKAMDAIRDLFGNHRYEWSKRFVIRDLSAEYLSEASPVTLEFDDVATVTEKSGHRIGKILPFVLLLMLVSGCSFASVDMIAGEKERGCFETILVSPISRRSVIIGKMQVVMLTGMASLLINLLSMLIWLKMGLFTGSEGTNFEFAISTGALVGVFVCAVPITVMIAALLMLISAKAKSYQSGQTLLMPVTLLSMIPAIAASLPGMHSDSYLVLLPVANVVVSMREMLEGTFILWPFIVGNLLNLGIAVLLVKAAVNSLDAEGRLVPGSRGERDSLVEIRRDPIRTGILGFAVVWLLFYYVAVPLQAKDLVSGLVITLWGLILLSGIFLVRFQKLSLKETLSLRPAHWLAWPGCLIFQLGFLPTVIYINNFIMKFIPIPEGLMEEFGDSLTGGFSVTALVLLMCVSPGICEEILFRGTLLGSFRRRWPPWKAILVSSLMFGFLHFSVYRMFATTAIGVGLGWLVVMTGSIYPAMLAHAFNNYLSLVVAPELDMSGWSEHWMLLGIPAVIIGGFLVYLGSRKQRL
ncbi:MAG TPA: ABC transporter permease subunit/CPBP intramembrane protease [bacterium]|nr:ABC transporter permease subunit/CPBP intramembrane protease [bacterium]